MFKNKALIPIAVVVFVDLLGFSMILPLLSFYAQHYLVSDQVIGYVVAVYSVCQFITSPILGGLSDRYGRRPVLIYSQLGSMIGFLVLGFANSIWMIVVSRFIDGISGGNITIASAYVADVTEPKDRSGAMAIIGIGFGLGFMIGPFISGELSNIWGASAPAFAAAALSFTSMLLTVLYLKEPQVHRTSIEEGRKGLKYYTATREYLKIKELRTILLIFFFFALPFSLYVSMFSLYANKRLNFTQQDVGRFLAYVGFLGIMLQGGIIRPMVKKFGETRMLRFGLGAMALGFVIIVFAENWWQLAIAALPFSFGTGMTRPVLSSLVSQIAPIDKKGGVLGVSASIESFTRILGPIMGGWIIGALHPNYIGYVGGALAAIGLWLALTIHRNIKTMNPSVIID